jgi:hypothetical protein
METTFGQDLVAAMEEVVSIAQGTANMSFRFPTSVQFVKP